MTVTPLSPDSIATQAIKLWVILSTPNTAAGDRSKVRAQHLAYQAELERRGLLFAAGPFLDDTGEPEGRGLIIIRASSRAEALEIALKDPFHELGYRTFTIQQWRLNEGTFTIRVDHSSGRFKLE